MTRTEIIAQLDAELSRLQSASDFLTAALTVSKNVSTTKARTKIPGKIRQQPAIIAAPAAIVAPAALQPILKSAALASPIPDPQPTLEPQVHRVPPKRRMERRHMQSEKNGSSVAALRGLVPSGPVAVSADEARKMQERAAPPVATPMVSELRSEIGSERSLGSLIQAFERRAGISVQETP
jgi:hypothetical protein